MPADHTLLTDRHWALLASLLPCRVGRRGMAAKDNRGSAEAVRWAGRSGVAAVAFPPSCTWPVTGPAACWPLS